MTNAGFKMEYMRNEYQTSNLAESSRQYVILVILSAVIPAGQTGRENEVEES